MEKLQVVDIGELANNWQIPLARVCYFIVECGMNPANLEEWVATQSNWDLLIREKQKAFEDSLFPRQLRPESTESSS